MNDQDIPTAKPGDHISLQTAPRPVMALGMGEEASEVLAMGLVPNAADGARVAIGAGLRQAATGIQLTLCALLDPQQALETAAHAGNAGDAGGDAARRTAAGGAVAGAAGSDEVELQHGRGGRPGRARARVKRSSTGTATPSARRPTAWPSSLPSGCRAKRVGVEGLLGCGNITMPDGKPWIAVDVRQGGADDADAPTANAVMSLESAIGFFNALVDRIQAAAERPEKPTGKPS
jgi:hypothetical protein